MTNANPQNVAYVQNSSHGLPRVALGLDWRQDDNLIVCAQECPSNYLCWIHLEAMGVEIRRVASTDGRVRSEQGGR